MSSRRIVLVAAVLITVCTGAWLSILVMEASFFRVNPAEEEIAEHIRALGGSLGKDLDNERHIVAVRLRGTSADDGDVAVVLRLPYLRDLDISGTNVTDASLDAIVRHPNIRVLNVSESRISKAALATALSNSSDRLFIDDKSAL